MVTTQNIKEKVNEILLIDRTTGTHILNTDTYIPYLSMPKLIPRCQRIKEDNNKRSKDKAEIFTPIRIVKQMNDMVMEEYHKENHSFDEYIDTTQLEITCGEGVFLATRYDSETGSIIPIEKRVGLLDRKLIRLCNEINNKKEFLNYIPRIAKSMYGYEYQGDSLLMARFNILFSFVDYYKFKYNDSFPQDVFLELSEIIVWNLFQMDGLTMCIPQKDVVKTKDKEYKAINGIPVKINNWKENKIEFFNPDLNS